MHHRWEKNIFGFDRACTARGKAATKPVGPGFEVFAMNAVDFYICVYRVFQYEECRSQKVVPLPLSQTLLPR